MLALLLPLAGLSIFLAFAGSGFDARRSFLHAAVAWGLLVVAITEGLGLFGAIHWATVAAAWCAAVAIALGIAWRGRGAAAGALVTWREWHWGLIATLAGAGTLLSGIALSAVYAPPNTIDVLRYHLPRVVFWRQAGDLGFFPTHHYEQLSMPPFHEFVMLHIFALTEGDRFVQLASLAALAGCAIGVSIIAKSFGCRLRGQLAAVAFCLTLPSAILQGSSAKNDLTVAFWLIVAIGFAAWRWDDFSREQAYGTGAAFALALLTKGTAYLYGPAILGGIWLGQSAGARRAMMRRIPILLALVLMVNAGYYLRNWNHNGHPLGDGTALAGEHFGYANERFGLGATVSNALRGATLQLVGRPAWNDAVHELALSVHHYMGWDPNDPATTWTGTAYRASRPGNHEATAANPAHLLLFILGVGWLAAGRRWGRPGWYFFGLIAAAALFCFYLRWQPWHARLQLALFIAAAPVFGVVAENLRSKALLVAVLGWLVWRAWVPLVHNELRPLVGTRNVFRTERATQYTLYTGSPPGDGRQLQLLADAVAKTDCRSVGIDAVRDSSVYPVMGLLLNADPAFEFRYLRVENATRRYEKDEPAPCAVVCPRCAGKAQSTLPYTVEAGYTPAFEFGSHLLFARSSVR